MDLQWGRTVIQVLFLSVSKSELSLQKQYLYRFVLKLKKVADCLIRTGRLFQRGTIRLKNESLKEKYGRNWGEDSDQLLIV